MTTDSEHELVAPFAAKEDYKLETVASRWVMGLHVQAGVSSAEE